MNGYPHILSRLYNTPLAITENKLDILSSEITLKLLANQSLATTAERPAKAHQSYEFPIIEVFDSLVSKHGSGYSGFTSYEAITAQIKNYINAGVSKIGFYHDSPGGEVAGMESLANFIASLPTVYGVETFGFTDGTAASASYALISACQRIYATNQAMVGSIGVLMTLVDMTKRDSANGLSYTILRSKSEKAMFNPHEEISQATLENLTKTLDSLDNTFNNMINRHRPQMSIESIKNMNGKVFLASEAKSLGLIDEIVASLDEVPLKEFSTTTNSGVIVMTLDEYKAKVAALEQELVTARVGSDTALKAAVDAERVRCAEIIKAGATLKIKGDLVLKRIEAGTSKADAVDVFEAIAESVDSSSAIDTTTVASTSTVSVEATAENDPLKAIKSASGFSLRDLVEAAASL